MIILAFYGLADLLELINIGTGVFIFAIIASLIIEWMTESYRPVKVALTNPVKSERQEDRKFERHS